MHLKKALLPPFYKSLVKLSLVAILHFLVPMVLYAYDAKDPNDTTPTSTHQQAVAILDKIFVLRPSSIWPNVAPQLFLQNLKENIRAPLELYEGSNTNFCGYAALSYLPLHDDPVGYIKFMLQLYERGG